MIRVPICIVLPALLWLASPASADFSAVSSEGFTYCFFDGANLDGESCVDAEYVPGGDCSGRCTVPGNYGQVSGRLPWEINGEGEMIEDDVGYWTYAIIHGDRASDTVFVISGACAYADPEFAGPPEVAVFRFEGDPSVFEGTSAVRVSEFVSLGLIDASDILYVNDCASAGQYDVELDVTGIPDDELVVFAGAQVSPGNLPTSPVPAVSVIGSAILALLMFGAGVTALRTRSRQRGD